MTHHRALRLFPLISALSAFVLAFPAVAQDPSAPVSSPVTAPALEAAPMALQIQNVSPPPPGEIPDIEPATLYGGDLVFDVMRKGTKIGEHRASFERNGDELTVRTKFNLAIDVLFFNAYSFEYDSTEIWRNGALVAMTANVDDNGKITKISARTEDDLFKVDGPKGTDIGTSWVFPTNHWHRGQANSKSILNTITGRFSQVEVVNKGIERVVTAQGTVDADHFEYTGQLRDTEVWYEPGNRWVKMRFKARDGSWIEYKCRQCGLAASAIAAPQAVGGL
jgi:hypothetical protein